MTTLIIIAVLMLITPVIVYLYWSGLFRAVDVTETHEGAFFLVFMKSSVNHAGQRNVMKRVMKICRNKYNVTPLYGFTAYLSVAGKKFKKTPGAAGCLLDPNDYEKMKSAADFCFAVVPRGKFKFLTLPLTTKHSSAFGMSKATEAFRTYNKENELYSGMILEIFDRKVKVIRYLQPLEEKGNISSLIESQPAS